MLTVPHPNPSFAEASDHSLRPNTWDAMPEPPEGRLNLKPSLKSHPNPASHPIQPATHSQSQQTCHLYPQLPILSSDLSPLVQSVHRSLLSTYYAPGTHLGIADEQGKQNLL